jgi:VWFA-related protein
MRREAQTPVRFTLIAVLLFSLLASAQDFKIRAKVDLVEVPVSVKSSGDKLVTGLTKADFVILEDGQRQTITTFIADPVPLSAAVIVDTGLTTASLSKIEKTIGALAGAFSEFDEVAIYRYDKFVTKVQDFSKDPESIHTAMHTIRNAEPDARAEKEIVRGPFSTPGPVINGAPVVPPGQLGVITTTPPKTSKVLHDAMFMAADDLGKRDRNRRKVVLVVSDGEATGSDHSYNETAQSLLEKGVQVYAVGFDQPFPYNKFSVLSDYAKTTGGDVFFENSVHNIEKSYATATEAARNQYVIGYISNNEVTGAGPVFREISVEVRGKNLKALHRKGYYQYP